jgi:thiol-disulfide isomerase/thioredoxin
MATKRRPQKKTRPDRPGKSASAPAGATKATTKASGTSPTAQRRAAALAARKRRQRLRVGLFSAAAVVLLGGVVALASLGSSSAAGTNTSTTAWVLPRLGGSGTVSLHSLRGKPVVVNMFASWCTECQAELPAFAAEARQLRGKVTFVEVNSLETGNGEAMAQQFGLAGAGAIVLADVGGAQNSGLHDALGGGNNMPVSAFYSASGQLLSSHVGAFSASTLQSQLTQLYGSGV